VSGKRSEWRRRRGRRLGRARTARPRSDDRPRIARARAGQPTGGVVGDQREAVGDQGIQLVR
jgi:hypothetical protein